LFYEGRTPIGLRGEKKFPDNSAVAMAARPVDIASSNLRRE
jgi:hypothetical protein